MRRAAWIMALLAGCAGCDTSSQKAELVGRYVWAGNGPDFGGWSGLEVIDEGQAFVAIGDRGILATGDIARADGVITDLSVTKLDRLQGRNGNPLGERWQDAEGLALTREGAVFVSLEGEHRVLQYGAPFTPATAALTSPEFEDFQDNSGMEALAIDADGTLYTLPERSGRADRPFPVLRYDGQAWTVAFDIPRRGAFLVAGADIGPDGLLYVLERDFTGVGFRTRVRRFDLSGAAEETLLQTPNGTHDNLEGISIWRDAAGDLIMTMISDDNFQFLQETEIVEYRIDG